MTAGAYFQIQGDAELEAKLKIYKGKLTAELAQTMQEYAGEILRRSAVLVPVDTGELKSRGFVEMVGNPEDETFAAVVGYEKFDRIYKGADGTEGKLYSVFVHERTDIQHHNGTAKFLEIPFKDMSGQFLRELADAADGVRP